MSKILIIDDDPDIVEAMKVVLQSKDYIVSIAESGEEGLKKVEDERPDLIILDVMMETSDKGVEVAQKLRKTEYGKDIPILMLTAIKERLGWDFHRESEDEKWLPVDDYVDKPLKPGELLTKVEGLLRKVLDKKSREG